MGWSTSNPFMPMASGAGQIITPESERARKEALEKERKAAAAKSRSARKIARGSLLPVRKSDAEKARIKQEKADAKAAKKAPMMGPLTEKQQADADRKAGRAGSGYRGRVGAGYKARTGAEGFGSKAGGRMMGIGMLASVGTMIPQMMGKDVPAFAHAIGPAAMAMGMFPQTMAKAGAGIMSIAAAAGPVGIGIAALGAITVGGIFAWKKMNENAREAGRRLGDFSVGSSKILGSMEEAYGKESAYAKYTNERAGARVGIKGEEVDAAKGIAESEAGKAILEEFQFSKENSGVEAATAGFTTNLVSAILQGIVTSSQAKALAGEIAGPVEGSIISKTIDEVVGKKGQVLARNPAEVAKKILERGMESIGAVERKSDSLEELEDLNPFERAIRAAKERGSVKPSKVLSDMVGTGIDLKAEREKLDSQSAAVWGSTLKQAYVSRAGAVEGLTAMEAKLREEQKKLSEMNKDDEGYAKQEAAVKKYQKAIGNTEKSLVEYDKLTKKAATNARTSFESMSEGSRLTAYTSSMERITKQQEDAGKGFEWETTRGLVQDLDSQSLEYSIMISLQSGLDPRVIDYLSAGSDGNKQLLETTLSVLMEGGVNPEDLNDLGVSIANLPKDEQISIMTEISGASTDDIQGLVAEINIVSGMPKKFRSQIDFDVMNLEQIKEAKKQWDEWKEKDPKKRGTFSFKVENFESSKRQMQQLEASVDKLNAKSGKGGKKPSVEKLQKNLPDIAKGVEEASGGKKTAMIIDAKLRIIKPEKIKVGTEAEPLTADDLTPEGEVNVLTKGEPLKAGDLEPETEVEVMVEGKPVTVLAKDIAPETVITDITYPEGGIPAPEVDGEAQVTPAWRDKLDPQHSLTHGDGVKISPHYNNHLSPQDAITPGNATVTVTLVKANSLGGLIPDGWKAKGFRSGGYISGAGGPTDDKIPALLSNGEYVMRAKAVDKYGADFMGRINGMRYADGGGVWDDAEGYAKGKKVKKKKKKGYLSKKQQMFEGSGWKSKMEGEGKDRKATDPLKWDDRIREQKKGFGASSGARKFTKNFMRPGQKAGQKMKATLETLEDDPRAMKKFFAMSKKQRKAYAKRVNKTRLAQEKVQLAKDFADQKTENAGRLKAVKAKINLAAKFKQYQSEAVNLSDRETEMLANMGPKQQKAYLAQKASITAQEKALALVTKRADELQQIADDWADDPLAFKQRQGEIGQRLAVSNAFGKSRELIDAEKEKLSYASDQESRAIEMINREYEDQEKSLEKIEAHQQQIASIEKGRLGVAQALSVGDIAGAARALQEAKTEEASIGREQMKSAMQDQKDARIKKHEDNVEKLQDMIWEIENKIRGIEVQYGYGLAMSLDKEIKAKDQADYNDLLRANPSFNVPMSAGGLSASIMDGMIYSLKKEVPANYEVTVNTTGADAEQTARLVMTKLKDMQNSYVRTS